MGSNNLKEVLVCLDGIIVFPSTLEEHETSLKLVLQQLREKILTKKMSLFPKLCVASRPHCLKHRGGARP